MHIGLENLHMTRAIHRLQGVSTILRLGREHVVLVILPVAGFFPEATVQDLRSLYLLEAVVLVDGTHVLLHLLPNGPSLRMPENQSWRFVLEVKQVQLSTQLAV